MTSTLSTRTRVGLPAIMTTTRTKDFGHYNIIEGWPQIRGFVSIISKQWGSIKVSGHYGEGGLSSGVAYGGDPLCICYSATIGFT